MLPTGVSVLGVLHHPSPEMAVEYFHDQSAFADRFARFCASAVRRFPRIAEWEVWNEPNASDFYLSVKDGDQARPWTPAEFVEHVLLPGGRAIRETAPSATIVISGLAEDGLVGMTDRPPALSNRIPASADFQRWRSSHPYGHFYFIPDFWRGLATELNSRMGEVESTFDACAFHPYPYFRLDHRADKRLLPATASHIEDFLKVFHEAALDKLDVWITEVGARSLDIGGSFFDSESQQRTFLEQSAALVESTPEISRLYWYHLFDLPFDLRQEKSFGLLNRKGRPRAAFSAAREVARRWHGESPRDALVERFAQTNDSTPERPIPGWALENNTKFAFALSDGGSGRADGGLLISPGRGRGGMLSLQSEVAVAATHGRDIRLALSMSLTPDSGPGQVDVVLTQHGESDTTVRINLADGVSIEYLDGSPQPASAGPDPLDYPFADPSRLDEVSLLWRGETLEVCLRFGELELLRSFTVAPLSDDRSTNVRVTARRTGDRATFIELRRLALTLVARSPLLQQPPHNTASEHGSWFLRLPSYSQIGQDDWVLQMLRFKRDGYFVEVGGHDGVANSNTVLLERSFGWGGVIVEANPRWHAEVCRNRTAIAHNLAAFSTSGQSLDFVDAGAVGGLASHLQDDVHASTRQKAIAGGQVIKVRGERLDEILGRSGTPQLIDYLSVDTEGSEVEVLRSLDFRQWRVALVTVEHAGMEEKRAEAWEILSQMGFRRRRAWFEDWFWHPTHLAEALAIGVDDVEAHVARVWEREKIARRSRLMSEAHALRDERSVAAAAILYEEAAKDFHPDNVHPLVEAIVTWRMAGELERALELSRLALEKFPAHPRVLRQSSLTFLEAKDWASFDQVMLPRVQRHAPDLLHDAQIASLLAVRPAPR